MAGRSSMNIKGRYDVRCSEFAKISNTISINLETPCGGMVGIYIENKEHLDALTTQLTEAATQVGWQEYVCLFSMEEEKIRKADKITNQQEKDKKRMRDSVEAAICPRTIKDS